MPVPLRALGAGLRAPQLSLQEGQLPCEQRAANSSKVLHNELEKAMQFVDDRPLLNCESERDGYSCRLGGATAGFALFCDKQPPRG